MTNIPWEKATLIVGRNSHILNRHRDDVVHSHMTHLNVMKGDQVRLKIGIGIISVDILSQNGSGFRSWGIAKNKRK